MPEIQRLKGETMFNEQLRDVLRKAEQALVKVFQGANSNKLNDVQQLAAMQYIHSMNDGIMSVFSNVPVEPVQPAAENSRGKPTVPPPPEGGAVVVETGPQTKAAPVETTQVKEMTKDAVDIADGKEQSRAKQQEKDSGVGAGGKVKKK